MLNLADWVRRLLWRDNFAPCPSVESLSLVLWVGAGQPSSAPPPISLDAWLFASSTREAVAMLREVARLGTVARVLLQGLDELSPAETRDLLRAARRLRCRGLWVEAGPNEPSTRPGA